ncbi:Emp24/gp25L/p24 family protein [Dictyocaulus viviparus]|uniref:Emp24/gp25L/p24 family protein n=1 Tax=Dictyocaulus viviparus TaxID=29172 RepID=A0A0D8YBZ3_DICVI|nr:Emp24/gp25L/p24 family protein [Dictyocaulus viviparus]
MKFVEAIISLLATLTAALELDLTVDVPPGKFQCFFQPVDINKHKIMEVDYQVVDGGDLNINFLLLFEGAKIYEDLMKTDGSHRVNIQANGDFQICFDNSFSYQTRKLVFFEIFLLNEKGEADERDVSKMGVREASANWEALGVPIANFLDSTNRIKSQLNKVEYYQAILRAHEARDRAIMTANFDRVTLWSSTHTIVMIAVGLLQVFLLRSLFEDNSKVGRLLRKGKVDYGS